MTPFDDHPPDSPLVPGYGRSTLADLATSVASRLGADVEDVVGLPAARCYVVVVIDGLGHEQLAAHADQAPTLAGRAAKRRPLTSGFPSTTATSLSSLLTGLAPGGHGVVGYTFRSPHGGRMNALSWEGGPEASLIFSGETLPTSLRSLGRASSNVSLARFEHSGLTQATMSGFDQFISVFPEQESDLEQRANTIAQAARESDFVYAYERTLDSAGHTQGVAHGAWRHTLRRIDGFVTMLLALLPDDACLIITGDHGMIDVPSFHRVTIEDEPELSAEIDLVAGEGRARQLYTSQPGAVLDRWQARLGDHAWVLSRADAIDLGLFGSVADDVRERIGDVLCLLRGDWAVMSREFDKEFSLVGMHGSATAAEMAVPLVVWHD